MEFVHAHTCCIDHNDAWCDVRTGRYRFKGFRKLNVLRAEVIPIRLS